VGEAKSRALWYIMYCSVEVKVVGCWEEGEGAGKGEGYHCERKPWGCSFGRQKKRGGMAGEGGEVWMERWGKGGRERWVGRVNGLGVLQWVVEAMMVCLSGCDDVVMELMVRSFWAFGDGELGGRRVGKLAG